jgi:hypothetical protein
MIMKVFGISFGDFILEKQGGAEEKSTTCLSDNGPNCLKNR